MHPLRKTVIVSESLNMFDFEKFEVYHLIKDQNIRIQDLLKSNIQIDQQTKEHWKHAMHQAVMNLVKATSRVGNVDKSDYVTMSRSNIFECAAILDMLKSNGSIEMDKYYELYEVFDQISKMLLVMNKSYLEKTEEFLFPADKFTRAELT